MTAGVQVEGLDLALALLDRFPAESERSQIRAVNRGIKAARTTGARAVSKDMGLKVGTVRDRLKMTQATPGRPQASLTASKRRIPLIEFKGTRGPEPSRGRGRGVQTGLKGGRRTLPHAFIATVGGRRGVFERKASSRLPIRELKGPSIHHVALKKASEIAKRAREVTAKELIRLLRRQFGGRAVG